MQTDEEMTKLLGDSEMTCTYEKVDSRTYQTSMKLRMHVSNENMQELDCTLSGKNIIKAGSFKETSVPVDNVITLKELQKRMPRIMTVWVDDQSYRLEQGWGDEEGGDISVKLIDNKIYLPMRTVVELMGDQVGWDEAARQAYVERDGQRIVLNGHVIDGITYVPKMELEKLSYEISWDDYDRSVTIEKR